MSFSQSLTHILHLLLEGVDNELEEGVVLLLLLGELLFGLARPLPQLGQGRVVGLLLLIGLPLPVDQFLVENRKLTLDTALPFLIHFMGKRDKTTMQRSNETLEVFE